MRAVGRVEVLTRLWLTVPDTSPEWVTTPESRI